MVRQHSGHPGAADRGGRFSDADMVLPGSPTRAPLPGSRWRPEERSS